MFVSGPSSFTCVVAYTCLPEATVPKLQKSTECNRTNRKLNNSHLSGQLIRLRTGGARDTRVVSTRRQHLTSKNCRALHHSVKRDRERTAKVTNHNVNARPKRQWVGGSQPWLRPDFLPNRTCSYELLEWVHTAGVRLC